MIQDRVQQVVRCASTPLLLASALLVLHTAHGAGMDAPHLDPTLRINQIQVLGTHNSYSAGVDPHVMELAGKKMTDAFEGYMSSVPPEALALLKEEHPNALDMNEMLKYEHPPLREQLDLGVRSLEIDINPDPTGGTYSDPVAYRMLKQSGVTDLRPFDNRDLDKPGFKVLHIPDIDFRSTCPTLRLCLQEVRGWSDAHPRHVPLFILIEAKIQDVPILPNATHTVPFSKSLFDELDHELVTVMGRDRILTPDDVRGNFPTLEAAVRAGHWPTLRRARGKVLFLMLTATGPTGAAGYLEGHPSLKGRIAFLRSTPGEDHAAFLLLDNAIVRRQEIETYVKQGYLVRTRSDIETYEAKMNDMTRARTAFASGAQIVSTDFERPGNAYHQPYMIALPGGGAARRSPAFDHGTGSGR